MRSHHLSLLTLLGFLLGTKVLSFAPSVSPLTTTTTPTTTMPHIIQGGMGVRISSWKLARTVSQKGELGVISGTAMDTILIRTLQDGDPDGSFRRALATFPDQDMVSRLMDKYYIQGGKQDPQQPYKHLPMWTLTPPQALLEACVVGNYCEVWLAKHQDDGSPLDKGWVGMNLLTKVQLPTLASLYGAMLADVDYILMGAGIPMQIPGILDQLAQGQDVIQTIDVEGKLPLVTTDDGDKVEAPPPTMEFSPTNFWKAAGKPTLAKDLAVKRPQFLPIVSSVVLAQSMLKRASGQGPNHGIDGFVVELPTAGGHNAPPRGFRYDPVTHAHDVDLNDLGEPMYGPKDEVNLKQFLKASKGLPFYMAGSYAKPERFADVMELGAAGVQVGTAFALSQESGMRDEVRQEILSQLAEGDLQVYTDPVASPTGFPFKVLGLEDTLADPKDYELRPRVCNLGYLRTPYIRPDGKVGFRCASEPVKDYVKKGGAAEACEGRKCLCNALCADAGFPQASPKRREGETERYVEQPLVTIGDDVNNCRRYMKLDEATGRWGYSAGDVVDYLKSEWEARQADTQSSMDDAMSHRQVET